MIQLGNWSGNYSFLNPEINKIRGFEKTNFSIKITAVEKNKFTGRIQDDLTTGGTEGVGEIIGQINNNKVEFVKKMPIMTILVDSKGTRKTYNKKHRPIYYSGEFSIDKKTVTGTWRFKFGFIWIGIIPIPVKPSKGTWSMTLVN
tara:strand:- start:1198 stop:1632 length:435 start_codon:yes stop_codon:yes gene_type:complete